MMRCSQCEMLRINGVACHETGCPLAWQDDRRECKWCGQLFTPEERGQLFCESSCGHAYHGIDELPGERQWDDEGPPEFDAEGGL